MKIVAIKPVCNYNHASGTTIVLEFRAGYFWQYSNKTCVCVLDILVRTANNKNRQVGSEKGSLPAFAMVAAGR